MLHGAQVGHLICALFFMTLLANALQVGVRIVAPLMDGLDVIDLLRSHVPAHLTNRITVQDEGSEFSPAMSSGVVGVLA
jgi:hypothetical protein